jgi:2-oxoglutarate ferredoxin oxidoreductase subunit gamma
MDQALMELGGKKPALAELNARALAAGKQFARSL